MQFLTSVKTSSGGERLCTSQRAAPIRGRIPTPGPRRATRSNRRAVTGKHNDLSKHGKAFGRPSCRDLQKLLRDSFASFLIHLPLERKTSTSILLARSVPLASAQRFCQFYLSSEGRLVLSSDPLTVACINNSGATHHASLAQS